MRLWSQYDMSDSNFRVSGIIAEEMGRSFELFHLILPTKKQHSEAAGNERIGRKISPSCLILTPLGLSFEEFPQGVLEFYTPRTNEMLPAEMVFGHQTRLIIPSHRKAFTDRWKAVIDACDRQNRHRRFHKNALWRPQQTLITFTNRGTGTHIGSEI